MHKQIVLMKHIVGSCPVVILIENPTELHLKRETFKHNSSRWGISADFNKHNHYLPIKTSAGVSPGEHTPQILVSFQRTEGTHTDFWVHLVSVTESSRQKLSYILYSVFLKCRLLTDKRALKEQVSEVGAICVSEEWRKVWIWIEKPKCHDAWP